ncbi:MAG: Fe-Mn family superoxide dismutase [Planctomycetota bacterium]|nr:Fe-Mn family superoxide dismutase [Planctomycetota bacterium]
MAIELPALPYEKDALAPHISGETLDFHYGKHHQAYVTNLNKMIEGTADADKSLEEIIQSSDGGKFNNAAQVWNHSFYWNCMKPGGGGEPTGALLDAINNKFGSVAEFKTEFKQAAMTQFGSGWAWLVKDGDGVDLMKTANADLPMKHGKTALLTCDVWEHAYYIDYRNARAGYVDAFMDHLLNWDFVAANFGA